MPLIKPKLIISHKFLCLHAMDKTRVTCKFHLKENSDSQESDAARLHVLAVGSDHLREAASC